MDELSVKQVPKILFEEFSEKYGGKRKAEIMTIGHKNPYLVKPLSMGEIGFQGALGLYQGKTEELDYFVIWRFFPRIANQLSYDRDDCLIMISAGPMQTGSYLEEIKTQEMVTVDFCLNEIPLCGHPYIEIIIEALKRADSLAVKILAARAKAESQLSR